MIGIFIQIFALILAYLLGSIPVALILGKKVKHIDIREYGSKNMGATNAFRVLGFKWGALTFLLDAIKGAIVVIFMKYIIVLFPIYTDEYFLFYLNPLFYALASFIGHLYPIFAHFKGGKGVSTGFGGVFAYAPLSSLTCLIIFIIVISIFKFVSLASIVSCFFAPFVFLGFSYLLYGNIDWYLFIGVTIISLIIIIKHIPNLKRLHNHTEQMVNFKAIKDSNEPPFIDNPKANKEEK